VLESHTEVLWNWLTDPVPDQPNELLKRVREAKQAFATECIEQLTVPVNGIIRGYGQGTFAAKQCLAEYLCRILDPVDLGIRCGEEVGRVTAHATGENGSGRFVIVSRDAAGRRLVLGTATELGRVQLGILRHSR